MFYIPIVALSGTSGSSYSIPGLIFVPLVHLGHRFSRKTKMTAPTTTDAATLREAMKTRSWGLHGIADKLLEGALLEKKMHIDTFKVGWLLSI